MSDDAKVFEVDQAKYITFGAVKKALDPEVMKQIKPVSTITKSSTDTSNASKKISYKLVKNDVFMGHCTHFVGMPQTNATSIRLTLEEISLDGMKGPTFFLTLYSAFCEEWKNNKTLKAAIKGGTLLVILQNVPYQITKTGVHFHLTSNKNDPWINFKNYFSTADEAGGEKYSHVTLTVAAGMIEQKFHSFAVVQSIIKDPTELKNGKGHGMYALVDPSCYENMVKLRDFRLHIFTSSVAVFPKIVVGDVIRIHRVKTEKRPNENLVDFRIFRETDLVVFPWNEKERPRCSNTQFNLSEDDIAQVQHLKTWSLERYKQHVPISTTQASLKIITLNEINASMDIFDLPCRLVEFYNEGKGVAMWVEDGTKCPLYTCSDVEIRPFDSQATQDLSNNCSRICIRCSKKLLAGLELNREMLLYLRHVKMTLQKHDVDVAQFEVHGSVELLPLNTRYHKSLLQRLEKSMPGTKDLQPGEHILDNAIETVQPVEVLQPAEILSPAEFLLLERQLNLVQFTAKQSTNEQPSTELSTKKQTNKDQPTEEQQLEVHKNKELSTKEQSGVKYTFKDKQKENSEPKLSSYVRAEIKLNESLRQPSEDPKVGLDESLRQLFEDPSPEIVVETSTEAVECKIDSQKVDQFKSSGECSTDREMKEIPSGVFAPASPSFHTSVSEDKEREAMRLHQLIHSEVDEDFIASQVLSRPAAQYQKLASLEEINFSQVVASTQKPAPNVVNESKDEYELSFSPEASNAQRLFSPGTESDSSNSKSPLNKKSLVLDEEEDNLSRSSLSPHPAFRAVDEVLDIKTNCGLGDCSESVNQLNVSINAPQFRPRQGQIGDQRVCIEIASTSHKFDWPMTKPNVGVTRYEKDGERITTIGDDRREELLLTFAKENSHQDTPMRKRKSSVNILDQRTPKVSRSRNYSNSSSCSVVEICQDNAQMSQESDSDSVVILDPASQDLEKLFRAIEEAQPTIKHFGGNISEIDSIQPGESFKLSARIIKLLPKQPSGDLTGLKSLLVALCVNCSHLWEYNHFIGSISQRVAPARNRPLVSAGDEDEYEDCGFGALNYLCCEEDHNRNMFQLAESDFLNIDAFESDEDVIMDRSFSFICPMCKARGVPDVLCALKPSFFFRLHATQKTEHGSTCRHILASGRHAEYFLGTKADHVLRSEEIWNRAEQRISKLVQNKQPLTLSLRRYEADPEEIFLENTKNVYSSNHILPW